MQNTKRLQPEGSFSFKALSFESKKGHYSSESSALVLGVDECGCLGECWCVG